MATQAKLNFNSNDAANADVPSTLSKDSSNKRLSVERIYQKKTQLEHILLRPDSYIGTVEKLTQPMWVYDDDIGMNYRSITFVPGLLKIFDEILVNAADNKQRDPKMSRIKVTIDPENNEVSIMNNGRGIPVIIHKEEKVFVPSLIFGYLLTSSNFDDSEKKVVGGRNGFGAKLCNVFSTKFTIETSYSQSKKKLKQIWTDNMTKSREPHISDSEGPDFTKVTFQPDLKKFSMDSLDKDIVALFRKRVYDMCATVKGVSVYLNNTKLSVPDFKAYIDLFVKPTNNGFDENDNQIKVIHEVVNPRWEIALAASEKGFQQVSFVNSIATTKGGRHVDYVTEQLLDKLINHVNKKNKGGIQVKPFQIKNHMWLFINCLIENPTFDSQTKENMTLQAKKFGSECKLSDKFIKQSLNCGIVEMVLDYLSNKQMRDLNKKGATAKKQLVLKGIPKLDDANSAGSKNSSECTLILTEGDSAKALAISGLGIIGRENYGVFPLRGKVLNVREANHKQIMENAEINNIMKIIGLQPKKQYTDFDDLKQLRYGKIMIMTDQDADGSHIKGLLVNFVHHFWPSLIKRSFLEEFITPIVKVTKGSQSISFYSMPEFLEWQQVTPNFKSFKVKYYKGLGTSTTKEAKEYFSDMQRHRIKFGYSGPTCDRKIELAFGKNQADNRKSWLLNFMNDRKERRLNNDVEDYLYHKDTKRITYHEFIDKELIQFSHMDVERSIPNVLDGLKPGQRKILFTCLKRNDKREVKVAQLAGSVAEHSQYHHGETSLMSTIINLAQNFVGSNNLNLLLPNGQFGTRLQGGKDAASSRYIFTMMSPLTRILFNPLDNVGLIPQFEDNQQIEPLYYCPILPMVLINGAEGIGTGWSTKLLNHDVREVLKNVRRMINGEEPFPLKPRYKNFTGTIEELEENKYTTFGEIAILDETTVEITELPINTWTQPYKENLMEVYRSGSEKVKPCIEDFKEYHTDTTVKFIVTMTPEQMREAEDKGLHKFFKLTSSISSTNMVAFDSAGCIRKYENTGEIFKEFYNVRLQLYEKRKSYLLGMLGAEAERLSAQARFILEKICGSLVVENKPKKQIITELKEKDYPSDPVKAWKLSQKKPYEDLNENDDDDNKDNFGDDYNYLLGMAMWNLTKEKKEEILKQRDEKHIELKLLKSKEPSDLWLEDLDLFEEELNKQEFLEKEEEKESCLLSTKAAKKSNQSKLRHKNIAYELTKPSEQARRVEPSMPVKCEPKQSRKRKGENALPRGQTTLKAEVKTEAKMESEETEEDCQPLSLQERLKAKFKSSPEKNQDVDDFFNWVSPPKKPKQEISDEDCQVVEVSQPAVGKGRKKLATKTASKAKQTKIVTQKKSPKKRKPKIVDSSDEDDFHVNYSSDGGDSDFQPVKLNKPSRTTAAKKTKYFETDSEDSDF